MVNLAFPETFTIVSVASPTLDALGNTVPGSGTITETVVTGAFAPFDGTNQSSIQAPELVQGQDTVLANPIVYLSPGSPVPKATDTMIRAADGQTYLVSGTPSVYSNPFTGDTPGAIVHLRRITG